MKKTFLSLVTVGCVLFGGFVTVSAEENTSTQNLDPQEQEILEEQRVELRGMWDDHKVDPNIVQPFGVDPGYKGIGSIGDILIALDSITDHVAIVKDSYTVIEAHPDTDNVAYRDNNWGERYDEIKGLRVSTSSTNKSKAVQYAEAQLGEPYSLFATRNQSSKWYCSLLVWRAYKEQGIDIEGTNGDIGGYVTPGDILDSPYTSVFYSSY